MKHLFIFPKMYYLCSMEYSILVIILIFIFLGLIILAGKGDFLIAGYNTAPKEEKEKYNIKRLRLLIGILLFICAGAMPLLHINVVGAFAFPIIVVISTVVILIMANTWAKKK